MKRWINICINNEDLIFFRNSLYILRNSADLESTLEMLEDGNMEFQSSYKEVLQNVLDQDDMFLRYIKTNSVPEVKKEVKLLGIEINTINACNMKCKYCFAIDGTHNKSNIMNKELAQKSVDFLFEHAAKRKTLYITIIGGEPFLNVDLFKFIVLYAEKKALLYNKKIRFFTTTNGTILNQDLKDFLDQHPINLMLSYDSQFPDIQNYLRPMKNGGGSWDIMKYNFEYFKNRRKSTVHITLTPYNYKIYEYAKYCYENGFECVHFDLVKSDKSEFQFKENQIQEIKEECSRLAEYVAGEIVQGKNISIFPIMDNMWALYKHMPKLNSCAVPFGQCCIGPDGNIYPCDVLMWDKYCLGNVEEQYKPMRCSQYKESRECESCWARYLCGGQCLSDKLQSEEESKQLYCDFKKHICKLQLFMFLKLSISTDYVEKFIRRKEEEYKYEKK